MKEILSYIGVMILLLALPFSSAAQQLNASQQTSTYIVIGLLVLLVSTILVYYKIWKSNLGKAENSDGRIASFQITKSGKHVGNPLKINKKETLQ